jgi:predicted permease
MRVFLFILTNNLIPIYTLIVLGIIIGKKFNLDVTTLSKLNLYVFVPAFIFVNVYTTTIPSDMLKALAIVLLILFTNWSLGFAIGRIRGFNDKMANAFTNSIMFCNSGNFGVPLITLIFSGKNFMVNGETPYLNLALTVQIIVLVVQNVATSTIGVFNANRASGNLKNALKKTTKMPALYLATAAFLFKFIPYDITQFPLWPALSYVRNGMISVSLLALGIQLAQTKYHFKNINVYISAFTRLIGGPIIALLFIIIFGIKGIIAQVLFISAGLPTSVNSALLSVEFNNSPNFSSQAVMMSTTLSALTLTVIIYIAGILFPV